MHWRRMEQNASLNHVPKPTHWEQLGILSVASLCREICQLLAVNGQILKAHGIALQMPPLMCLSTFIGEIRAHFRGTWKTKALITCTCVLFSLFWNLVHLKSVNIWSIHTNCPSYENLAFLKAETAKNRFLPPLYKAGLEAVLRLPVWW